jgi:hypothetical protein
VFSEFNGDANGMGVLLRRSRKDAMFQPQPHGDVAIDPLGTNDMTDAALSTTLMQIEWRGATCRRPGTVSHVCF